ncbi:MAG: putative glycosyltransferase EpsJ [candidate division WS2 bacterium ADurb.Bin280]|uniref:Putative glycosyltransferase EpsJ n=1 Tax=candidate division WS2 bacterium ADurb.Bin280 TaxID=1852829 RepID=A0A1V5SEF2_9BACT|nr:MAG: putative glycosyltransferase EpsJ [candidate division WS2 bacterium ADurb.Bin280]
MPKFSIIMPAYNREGLLKEAIDSIIDQTYQDWELIIVDDKSTDKTLTVAKEYENLDKRIKVVALKKNQGPSNARNRGIAKSSGEFIVFNDSDDTSSKDRLEEINKAISANRDCDVLYSYLYKKSPDGSQKLIKPHPFDKEFIKVFNFIPNSVLTIKKDLFELIGGYDNYLRTAEDYDLILSLIEQEKEFLLIKKPLYIQRVHETNTTTQTPIKERIRDLEYVRKKHRLNKYSSNEAKKLCKSQKYWKRIDNEFVKKIWF